MKSQFGISISISLAVCYSRVCGQHWCSVVQRLARTLQSVITGASDLGLAYRGHGAEVTQFFHDSRHASATGKQKLDEFSADFCGMVIREEANLPRSKHLTVVRGCLLLRRNPWQFSSRSIRYSIQFGARPVRVLCSRKHARRCDQCSDRPWQSASSQRAVVHPGASLEACGLMKDPLKRTVVLGIVGLGRRIWQ